MENSYAQGPFGQEDASIEEIEDARDQNPYTAIEGYALEDAAGERVGEIEETVYDAVGDILKYVVVNGRAVPTDGIEVNAEEGRVRVPYRREIIGCAPTLEDPSGEFDRALRSHYGSPEMHG